MLTVSDVADKLQVSLSIVYALIDAGKLACYRIGLGRGAIRISEDDLEKYLEQCREAKPQINGQKLKHIKI